MIKRIVLIVAVLGMGLLAVVSCRRSDIRRMTIDVPQMTDARSLRIVTNAALDEVIGQYDSIANNFEIDLARKIILYRESKRLLSPDYQRRIEDRVAEVGFKCRVMTAQLNPPALVPTEKGPVQMWPDRHTAVISVPDMTSNTDANIVVDAIAYARIGADSPRVSVNGATRQVMATYESLCLSLKNIEYAIACVGFDANNLPARLGQADSIPHGWTPVKL